MLIRITYKEHYVKRPFDISAIFKKYIENTASPEEIAALLDYFRSNEDAELMKDLIDRQLQEREVNEWTDEGALKRVYSKLNLSEKDNSKKSIQWWLYFKVAASIVLILSLTTYLYWKKDGQQTSEENLVDSNKTVLTLASGKSLVLDQMNKGALVEETGIIVRKTADGEINYEVVKHEDQTASHSNKLLVPKGQQYQITLADGTKVWLNASSSLTFPLAFNDQERRVILTGEAYFEVSSAAKAKQPFIVETAKQQVQVLGTHFNVKAYDDEQTTYTTLLEGAVRVIGEQQAKILKPGQQSALRADKITVKKVEMDQVLDWKNGDFNFIDEDIKSIMKKISRWYDVEVVYEDNITTETFVAQISRKKSLQEVLKNLSTSGSFSYRLDGRKLILSGSGKLNNTSKTK